MIVLMQKVRGAVIFALFQRHGEQPPCVLLFCFSNALFFYTAYDEPRTDGRVIFWLPLTVTKKSETHVPPPHVFRSTPVSQH